MLALKYRCGRCAALHADEDDAIECCYPRVSRVWSCPICGDEYEDGLQPDNCCEDGVHRKLNARELEAAGQQRLRFTE